jgi:outer membrane protein OmpA-like peptidoglycan-associated protein
MSLVPVRSGSWGFAGLVLVLLVGAASCATPPKPPELEAFERMRKDPAVQAAAKRNPDLISNSDRLMARATEQWQDNELSESRNSALLGQIKLKQALAEAEQEQGRQRIASADSEIRSAQDEYGRLQRELNAVNEQVNLLKRLQESTAERQKLAQQITTEQARAQASDRISEAELAVKTADTVNASAHAREAYAAAVENLARARQEMQNGNSQGAETSAQMAKAKADEAAATAKPLYEQEAQAAENKARAEALARDAAAIPGVIVRREARGSLQRLVIPLPAERLFVRRGTSVAREKEAGLDPIASLLKKYSSYPVQIVGYTDNRGRAGEQLAFSLARAESVFSSLALRGVDAKRMVVSGQGAADPIADNRTATGRATNNRIEIVFLYQ